MFSSNQISAWALQDIPRSATRRETEHGGESRQLSAWAHLDAFVLLAEPGAGKSRAFRFEAEACGGVCRTARDFANVGPPDGWRGEIIFIDGLDEMRADSVNRSGPLDRVIQRLNDCGRPRFRLSCREADWLAAADHQALLAVAPGERLDKLYLDPLNDDEVTQLLRRHSQRVPDPEAFRKQAAQRGLDGLLRNPLLLELLVDAVGSSWPRGRADVFQRACRRMAIEHNQTILEALGSRAPLIDQVLDDAGLLCAVLLLAGLDAFITGPLDMGADASLSSLPAALGVVNAEAATASNLFIPDGTRRLPRHRSVAEYLAASAIGRRVNHGGLPMARVLALMSGIDGGIVEPLRGLAAWLALTCPPHRLTLIDRDPMACVLYGDAHAFHRDEKRKLLNALRGEAERFVWFRRDNWVSHPFGALGTPDMRPDLVDLLCSADRSPVHQSLLECALDAIRHGETMPGLLPYLEAVIPDASFCEDVRVGALEAWLAQAGTGLSRARRWLDDIQQGAIEDAHDRLSGRLLDMLYPGTLLPTEVMKYFRRPNAKNYIGQYRAFWLGHLIERTPPIDHPLLADGLVSMDLGARDDLKPVIAHVVAAALNALRAPFDVPRVLRWLDVCVNQYGDPLFEGDPAQAIRDWLGRNADVQKLLMALCYARDAQDSKGDWRGFMRCEGRLYRARPRDWYRWLLAHAGKSESKALAEYALRSAAYVAIERLPDFDIDMESVEQWVAAHRSRWAQVDEWLEKAWSLQLDDWRRQEHVRQRRCEAQQIAERKRRRKMLAPHLGEIASGRASPGVMHSLAIAHQGESSKIAAKTPEGRVQEFLGGDADEAARAIEGFEATLKRSDLPSFQDILTHGLERQHHPLEPVCLLGADLAYAGDPGALVEWSDDLARQLVAFRLSDGSHNADGWYNSLARQRPQIVADVLSAYARQCLSSCPDAHTGLWPLAREDEQAELARIVVPHLLRDFPVRAKPWQLRKLNSELLPAAVRHLPLAALKAIVDERRAMQGLDSGQRIAWLLIGLRFAPRQRSHELSQLIAFSRVRALRLGDALHLQAGNGKKVPRVSSAVALGRLIELLAPHTSPEFPNGFGYETRFGRLRDLVRELLSQLEVVDDDATAGEIERLRSLPALAAWKVSLDAALFDRRRMIRAAGYVHPSVAAVAGALSGQTPANALDLAALVRQQLQDLQARVRGDDTNSLREFWRRPADREWEPRIENECRDRLIAMLREPLSRLNVRLNKETPHAGDTRSDMRAETMVDGRQRSLPIEIKKETHPHLWTAWRDQLAKLYMTDPAAEGVGIYLVLWFAHRPKPDSDGPAASSPHDLEEKLTALVPIEDRLRLQVCVLDLCQRRVESAGIQPV